MKFFTMLLALLVAFFVSVDVFAQATTRVSVDSNGVQANGSSLRSAISADEHIVVFASDASNLVSGDSNGFRDIFVYDRISTTTLRVSVNEFGTQGNGTSDFPSISADGRFVVFRSVASNLVLGDVNTRNDIFRFDLQTGVIELVSVSSGGILGNLDSDDPSISPDGRYVAFGSHATNLVPGDTNGKKDVFIRDCLSSITTRVSVSSIGVQGNGDSGSFQFSTSLNGRFVVFTSDASNLVPQDVNGLYDLFVHDCQLGLTELVSIDSANIQGNNHTLGAASISWDGRFVAFGSDATNLFPGDVNGAPDILLRDRQVGTTELVSMNSQGVQSNSYCYQPVLSSDSNFIAFQSHGTNLVPFDTNGEPDIFVRDRQNGTTERLSVDSAGVQGNSHSHYPSISGTGNLIAFYSNAANLVPGDTNGLLDVFVRERGIPALYYEDLDQDLYGNPLVSSSYPYPPGYVVNNNDCDDTNGAIHPGALEICDGLDNDCDGEIDEGTYSVSTYCTAGVSVHGCLASIDGEGVPSSSASSGFDIVVHNVDGNHLGLILYGFYPFNMPWAPGSPSYLCIAPPVQRLAPQNSGGTLGYCDGELRVDFNAWMTANPYGLGWPFMPGQTFRAQGWFRDSAAPGGSNLSNALVFTLCQ